MKIDRARFTTAASLASLLLAVGCGGEAPPSLDATVLTGDEWGRLAVEIRAGQPPLEAILLGGAGAEDEPDRIYSLAVRRQGEERPFQTVLLPGLELPRDGWRELVVVEDADFDGYADLRIAEGLTAGPNVAYIHFLWDPATGSFAAAPELDAIVSPVYDAEARRIRSEWRDGAARYGSEVYEVVDRKPVLVRREERLYEDTDLYQLRVWEPRDGELVLVEDREVQEGEDVL